MTAPTSFPSVPEALAYLEGLGSPDAIAEELWRRGVKAEPGDCEECAVAVFLKGVVQDLVLVSVSPVITETISAPKISWFDAGNGGVSQLPSQVNAFACAFDAERYVDLITAEWLEEQHQRAIEDDPESHDWSAE